MLVDNIFCMVSINKRIPHQGHWINPTIMPFGGGVKISRNVHSNPKSVIMCWEHLLTAHIPRVSVKRQRSGELLEARAIVSRVPCAASVSAATLLGLCLPGSTLHQVGRNRTNAYTSSLSEQRARKTTFSGLVGKAVPAKM